MLIFLILSVISYIRKRIPLLVFALFMTFSSRAQVTEATDEFPFSVSFAPGISFSRVTDEAFSSLPFIGSTPMATLALEYYHARFTHHIEMGYTAGKLSINDYPEFAIRQRVLEGNYSAWYDMTNTDKPFKFQLGASIMIRYDHHQSYQFSNHNITYQWIGNLSISPRLSYFFGNNESRWSIVEQPDIAILSASNVSDFGGDEVKQQNQWSANPVFSQHRFRNTISIGRDINERNRFSLGYVWDLSKFTDYPEVNNVQHQVKLMYSFRF